MTRSRLNKTTHNEGRGDKIKNKNILKIEAETWRIQWDGPTHIELESQKWRRDKKK